MTLNDWLRKASQQLAEADIPTARLDAELILAHALGVDRTWVIAHGDETFPTRPAVSTPKDLVSRFASAGDVSTRLSEGFAFPAKRGKTGDQLAPSESAESLVETIAGPQYYADHLLRQRLQHIPLAYLLGHKEFYGRTFAVTPDVLIPRPETETLIDIARELTLPDAPTVCDVGTGSGCIAITLALELPQSVLYATDISPAALDIARHSATALSANVTFVHSNLLDAFHNPAKIQNLQSKIRFDLIVANLPYVDPSWQRSPETDHEPSLALFAEDNGLALISQLIAQAPACLTKNGRLLLEADPEQHDMIVRQARQHGFRELQRRDYVVALGL